MKIIRKLLYSAIACTLVGCMAACGSSSPTNYKQDSYSYSSVTNSYMADSYYEECEAGYYDYYESEAKDYYDNGSANGQTGELFNDSARKLIKTYNLTLETENYDELLNALTERIAALGGYVESLQNYNGSKYGYNNSRSASITARVPAKNADAFIAFVGDSANITRNTLSVEDVTLTYVDTESRKATYEVEQERLLALLEKAENLQDILVIEERLTEVRYKLESMASQLRTYDNLVDYSTIYLSINEVKEYTAPEPETFGERLSKSFTSGLSNVWEGLKNFTIGFAGALPGLVVFAIIVAIIFVIVRAIAKKSKAKRIKKNEALAAQRMAQAQRTAEERAQNGQ